MSGTSSSTSSSLSSLGSFSMSSWVRTSISRESPARRRTPLMSSDSSATRSSSARAKTTQRRLSSSCSLSVTTSPENSPSRTSTTLRLSFRTTSLPLRIWPGSMSGCEADAHLAPAAEHVDRAVLVDPEEGAVGRRRLGELLDLLAQRGQLLLGLLQGEGQLLVLRRRLRQLALRFEQPLLEGLHPARALLQPAAERVDLILGVRQLGAQRLKLGGGFVGSCVH